MGEVGQWEKWRNLSLYLTPGYQWNLTSSSSGFSQAVISQLTAFPSVHASSGQRRRQVTSLGSLGAPFSASAPTRRTAGGLDLRGCVPPPQPAPPSGGDWAPSRIARTSLAPALPALTPAIFNPLTVVSPSAGWHLLLCQSCASSPSSRTYAPFPCPALASSSPSSYSSAGSPRLTRPRAKRLHAQPSTRGTARPGRQLKGGRLGRYGRSFSCENHDPGGPE